MRLPPGLRLSCEDCPSREQRALIEDALGAFNAALIPDQPFTSFGIFVRDDADATAAGLIGNTYAGWLFIALLWVREDLRRAGIGRMMMAEAERRARQRGCHSIWLDTFSFQAPGFYAKLGFREFGRLDYPPGHQRIFLQKQLSAE